MIKCSICGEECDETHYYPDIQKDLRDNKLCFNCHFWKDQHYLDLNERGEHNYAIVNGNHYVLCPPTNSPFKGFGGALFKFKFNDGTIKECNNTWYQGNLEKDAHPHWRELMPDNAVLL